MTDLANYIKEWRKRAEFSQPKAAEALQMPLPTLRGIEQGRPFKYAHLLILAIEGMEARGYGKATL